MTIYCYLHAILTNVLFLFFCYFKVLSFFISSYMSLTIIVLFIIIIISFFTEVRLFYLLVRVISCTVWKYN